LHDPLSTAAGRYKDLQPVTIATQEATMNRNTWPKVFSALAVGIGVGAALGILFAPNSGEETREYLAGRAGEGLDEASSRARKMARRAQKSVGDAAEYVKSTAKDVAGEGERAYRNAQNASS